MRARTLIGVVALAVVAASVVPGNAQEPTAEVRTWGGQSWLLAQAALEMTYTVAPKVEEAPLAPPGAKTTGAETQIRVQGPPKELSTLFEKNPAPLQAVKQAEAVTLYQGDMARHVPLASIASLVFFRNPIPNSQLPPWAAATHVRYSASAVLNDGTRIDGDYVNLGTAVLRGMTPQGAVDIPWQEIELVRFAR